MQNCLHPGAIAGVSRIRSMLLFPSSRGWNRAHSWDDQNGKSGSWETHRRRATISKPACKPHVNLTFRPVLIRKCTTFSPILHPETGMFAIGSTDNRAQEPGNGRLCSKPVNSCSPPWLTTINTAIHRYDRRGSDHRGNTGDPDSYSRVREGDRGVPTVKRVRGEPHTLGETGHICQKHEKHEKHTVVPECDRLCRNVTLLTD